MPQFRITGPDGKQYNVTAPDGASENDVLQYVQANTSKPDMGSPEKQSRPVGERAVRLAGMGAKGFADSALETVGAVPDAVAAGMRGVGLPAPEAGFYTNKLKDAWNTVGGAMAKPVNAALNEAGIDLGKEAAENTLERGAYGAGRGAADAAGMYLPAAGIAKVTGPGLTQEVAKTLATQPVVQTAAGMAGGAVGEATDSPLLGAATAMAVPVGIGVGQRLANPVRASLPPEQSRLAGVAAQEGIPLTPGQQTGSRPLQAMESVFGTMPLTSGPQRAIQQGQSKAFNQAVLKRAGIEADTATPEILEEASKRLGAQFDNLSNQTTINFDDDLLKSLNKVSERYATKLPTNVRPIVDSYVSDLGKYADGMPGTVYQQARSDLTRQAKATANSDPTLSMTLRGIRDALDDAAERSLPGELKQAWQDVRRQYGNLKTIEKAMSNTTSGAAAGDISPTQLSQAVKQGGNYARGGGDLNELSRVGTAFLRDQVPNSGTAERAMMANLLTGGVAGTVGIGVNPLAGIATLLAPRAAQMAYNTAPVQNWLTKGLQQADPGTLSPVALAQLKQRLIAEQLQGPTPKNR
jgi:hypothetical protein